MSFLKEVCHELEKQGDEIKNFWKELWNHFNYKIGQPRYEEEIKRIEKFQRYDCSPSFRIAFMGEQSCGKSIFVNELMKEEIVLSGAAEVTFVPTVIVFGEEDAFRFFYYTQKEIKEVLKPYYEYYTREEAHASIARYKRDNPNLSYASLDMLSKIQDFQSLKNLDIELLKLIYYVLGDITKDWKIATDFVNFVYAIKTSSKLSCYDERESNKTSFSDYKKMWGKLKKQENFQIFPILDPTQNSLYEMYLVHHVYQTVKSKNIGDPIYSSMEFVDLPGIDAISIRVRYASLFFLKEVDALILMTDTQKALTLSGQEILRMLMLNKQNTDIEDTLFIAINKYDTINAIGKEENLESFRHTLHSVQNNIKSVIGNARIEIFIISALMSQFFRKQEEGNLIPENKAKLEAFLAMKNNPNLAGDPQIDSQIHSLFTEKNLGGIPYVRERLEQYLHNTSLRVKKRYLSQTMQGFMKEMEDTVLSMDKEISQQWQRRSLIENERIKERLTISIQLALSSINRGLESIGPYMVPLQAFCKTLKEEVQKADIASTIPRHLAGINRYHYVQQKLEEILKNLVYRFITSEYQETINKALTPIQSVLDLLKNFDKTEPLANAESLKRNAEEIDLLWKIHRDLLYLRLLELVAEKPKQETPVYLQLYDDPNAFVNKMKDTFLQKLELSALVHCTSLWHYPLYCLQKIHKALQAIKEWTERQPNFPNSFAKIFRENTPENQIIEKEYNTICILKGKMKKLQESCNVLQEKIQQATY